MLFQKSETFGRVIICRAALIIIIDFLQVILYNI